MKNIQKMLLLAALTALQAQACRVTVTNDIDQDTILFNTRKPNDPGNRLPAGQETTFGSKEEMADFIVVTIEESDAEGDMPKEMLRVKQTRCGMSEEEESQKKDKSVTVSGILSKDLGDEMNNYFTVEGFDDELNQQGTPVETTSCCCKH